MSETKKLNNYPSEFKEAAVKLATESDQAVAATTSELGVWTSQTLLDTFSSYNVTSMRGVYEQRQAIYPRIQNRSR